MGAKIQAAVLTSVAIAGFSQPSILAATAEQPPHVDTSGVNLQPPYPPTAMQSGERGATVLGVAVTADGKVMRVALIETSGFNDLDGSAISTVLGWKFVPAMKDGAPAEGTTMVKLIFEPPAAAPASSNSAGAQPTPPPASQPLFPAQLTMSADDGKAEIKNFPVPCSHGAFEGTLDIQHDAKPGGKMASFVVRLSGGGESALFGVHHIGSRLVGAEIDHELNGEYVNGTGYWGSGEMGVPIPISVGWGSGQLTGNGGLVFGEHKIGLTNNPDKLELSAYSGNVAISNPRLVCLPNRPQARFGIGCGPNSGIEIPIIGVPRGRFQA